MDREVEENYSANHQANFTPLQLDYSLDHHQRHHHHQNHIVRQQEASSENSVEMVDYMLSNPPHPQREISLDKLSFADVMQFADFGPKLALNQSKIANDDDNYFLKFQLLNDHHRQQDQGPSLLSFPQQPPIPPPFLAGGSSDLGVEAGEVRGSLKEDREVEEEEEEEEEEGRFSENASSVQQLGFGGRGGSGGGSEGQKLGGTEVKNKRKRPRTLKTSEEVESQRMTHIAVERNRRRQMNEHLRVLRSLMPGSYVQRGDQASIIGGAIEFVRELEQLLQCLESQKQRRLYGTSEAPRTITDAPPLPIQQSQQPPFFPPLALPGGSDNMRLLDLEQQHSDGLREEMAENKSCLADIEVRLLGFDAMIKVLSRRRPGQLIKTIAALEDLQFNILHTNITTIEQTVLYSFNVKITGETRCTAEDIANSVQQILGFIDTNTF